MANCVTDLIGSSHGADRPVQDLDIMGSVGIFRKFYDSVVVRESGRAEAIARGTSRGNGGRLSGVLRHYFVTVQAQLLAASCHRPPDDCKVGVMHIER